MTRDVPLTLAFVQQQIVDAPEGMTAREIAEHILDNAESFGFSPTGLRDEAGAVLLPDDAPDEGDMLAAVLRALARPAVAEETVE